jgi:hypothetical protein
MHAKIRLKPSEKKLNVSNTGTKSFWQKYPWNPIFYLRTYLQGCGFGSWSGLDPVLMGCPDLDFESGPRIWIPGQEKEEIKKKSSR